MAEGIMLPPGGGRLIRGGGVDATLKVAGCDNAHASTFVTRIPPSYDVGAHVHRHGEELFYVLEGTVDLLAFEPVDRGVSDWHDWVAADGRSYLRGGPGSLMFVPSGVPHAFSNLSDKPATIFFQAAPSGHENYFIELAELLESSAGRPMPEQMVKLREKYDMAQLTALDRK